MAGIFFDESLVAVIDDPIDTAQVESTMADIMFNVGAVKDTYAAAIAARERDFPTALEVGEINVAIPHCDTEHVNKDAVCVVILRNP